MALLRGGKLFAGALFSGLLLGGSQEAPAVIEQPSGGVVRERVIKYELRTLKGHTYQQLTQESGSRLYAIDSSLSLFANSEQKLRTAELGILATSTPILENANVAELAEHGLPASIQPVITDLQVKHIPVSLFAQSELVSIHYQFKQSQHSIVESAEVIEPRYVKSESVSQLLQSSVSDTFVSLIEIPVVKDYLITEIPTIKDYLTVETVESVIGLQQASQSEVFASFADIEVKASSVSKFVQKSISQIDISQVDIYQSVFAKQAQYLAQSTIGKVDVEDDEMLMVLLLLESMEG